MTCPNCQSSNWRIESDNGASYPEKVYAVVDEAGDKGYQNPEVLEVLYGDEQLMMSEIGELFDCSKSTISNWLSKHGIQTRHQDSYKDRPWTNANTLEELYHEKGMTQQEMADKMGCSRDTVVDWMHKHGIETDYEYEWNIDQLERLYHDEGMSLYEIADELECSAQAVKTQMERCGLERRSRSEAAKNRGNHDHLLDGPPEWYLKEQRQMPATYRMDKNGHMVWRVDDGKKHHHVAVHRLLAVAEGTPPSKIFGTFGKNLVHHRNGVPWDNRPENLKVMGWGEHSSHHLEGNDNARK